MRPSPRTRRLHTDLKVLQKLKAESTILDYTADGDPPESYVVIFRGKGLCQPAGSSRVRVCEVHEVAIDLGVSYPRMMPEMSWQSPIFHPNISGGGVVCLGGYGTYWVPSLNLDELCEMLWDMIRYQNYDVTSPYNREAAGWAKSQREFRLPIDPRPIRDKLAGGSVPKAARPNTAAARAAESAEVLFLDEDDIMEAEIVEPEDPDILIIE